MEKFKPKMTITVELSENEISEIILQHLKTSMPSLTPFDVSFVVKERYRGAIGVGEFKIMAFAGAKVSCKPVEQNSASAKPPLSEEHF